LWFFGVCYGYFSIFWYVVPRKIWQPRDTLSQIGPERHLISFCLIKRFSRDLNQHFPLGADATELYRLFALQLSVSPKAKLLKRPGQNLSNWFSQDWRFQCQQKEIWFSRLHHFPDVKSGDCLENSKLYFKDSSS
jgi:hypothetical protein